MNLFPLVPLTCIHTFSFSLSDRRKALIPLNVPKNDTQPCIFILDEGATLLKLCQYFVLPPATHLLCQTHTHTFVFLLL